MQITMVDDCPDSEGARSLVSLESLYGIWTLKLEKKYFFLPLASRCITLERTNKLLFIYPVS